MDNLNAPSFSRACHSCLSCHSRRTVLLFLANQLYPTLTMDVSVLQTILASQDQAYKSSLEIFLKQINGKIQDLQVTVHDLTRSLEFTQTEVSDLKQQLHQLEQEKNA